MEFRPCIDIHNGSVKQIVGNSLKDNNEGLKENFTSDVDSSYYASLYRDNNLTGGHIILLNPSGTPEYEADKKQALLALKTFPNGMQIGGGINPENAPFFIENGASHVIVTSYIFDGETLDFEKLKKMSSSVTPKHLVLDLSCRKKDGDYYVVTNRWQTFTSLKVDAALLDSLSEYCDEFLIHGVDVEGHSSGFEKELIEILSKHTKNPITYAGGINSIESILELKELGSNRINYTIGSSLDLFGGKLKFDDVIKIK